MLQIAAMYEENKSEYYKTDCFASAVFSNKQLKSDTWKF